MIVIIIVIMTFTAILIASGQPLQSAIADGAAAVLAAGEVARWLLGSCLSQMDDIADPLR